jgi:hypothetical protein
MGLTNTEAEKLSSILFQLEKFRAALASRDGEVETEAVQQRLDDAGSILALVLTSEREETRAGVTNPESEQVASGDRAQNSS